MKTFTALVTAVAALAPTVIAAECWWEYQGPGSVAIRYYIDASGLDSVSGRCGGLWDNMNGFSQCAALSETTCEEGENPGDVKWQFTAPSICEPGMVEAAWWGATSNEFGGIDCTEL